MYTKHMTTTKFYFPWGATMLKISDLAPRPNDTGLKKIWVAFRQGANLRYIPINDIRHFICSVESKGIPFFNSFTGCDVSAFLRKCKRAAWQKWDVYPEAEEVFTKLSMYLSDSGRRKEVP